MEEIKESKKVIPPIRATIPFKTYPTEIWKEFFPEGQTRRYMVSNLGRVASFYKDVNIDGYILKLTSGEVKSGLKISLKRYYKDDNAKSVAENQSFPVHNLVAGQFLEKTDPDQKRVLHIDYDKTNNFASNLKWATLDEALAHLKADPSFKPRTKGLKLNVDRVRLIKKKLAEGKTKQTILAKQFGLSEMAIYRIKTGKNWADVKI
ncbi:NUMOD4 domain-containing protein [Emticicia sp.]|uniref:NUMOD4 domain-containing protein n=1 Tax=Emticicia sp. TaxID=1930953 RepID=UPI0037531DB9